MGIYEEVEQLLAIHWPQEEGPERERVRQEWDRRFQDLLQRMEKADIDDLPELYRIVKDDVLLLDLPAELGFSVFKKIHELNPEDGDVLLTFAGYLYMYGPDWDRESEEIEALVKAGEPGRHGDCEKHPVLTLSRK
jgi:hypothetical protein